MKNILKNFMYNLSYQIFSVILPIVTIPYITNVLSQENIGINSVFQANTNYFVLIGMLGITTYGSKEIAKCQNSKNYLKNKFIDIYKIQFFCHLISLCLYYIYLQLINNHKDIGIMYFSCILASMFDISWFFIGIEDFKSIAIRNIFVKIIAFFSLFIFVRNNNDIYAYILTLYIPQIIINIYMWLKINKLICFRFHDFIIYKIKKSDITESVSLFVPQIASSIYTVLDKTVLSFFVPFSQIAIYDQGQIVLRLLLAIVPSFSKVMMPRITNSLYNDTNDKRTKQYMIQSSNIISFLSFGIFFGLISLVDYFVDWYFPLQYNDVKYVLIICSLIILAVSGSNLISVQYLIPLGKQNIYTISLVISAILNLIFNFLLIPLYGIYGACISSVIAECIGCMIQIVYVSKYLSLKELFSNIYIFVVSGLVMTFFICFIKCFIKSCFTALLILALVGLLIYIIMCILLLKVINKKSIKELFKIN